jgi:hypothetical protein
VALIRQVSTEEMVRALSHLQALEAAYQAGLQCALVVETQAMAPPALRQVSAIHERETTNRAMYEPWGIWGTLPCRFLAEFG